MAEKFSQMFAGEILNPTEKRPVLHAALRMPKEKELVVPSSGQNATQDVHKVLEAIKAFSENIRTGKFKGYSGKDLSTVVVIGIGGSYLGPEYVYEALR